MTSPKQDRQRTIAQNKSLHLLFRMVSDELNNQGQTVQMVLGEMLELTWTPIMIKEVWRQIQIAMLDKVSTTELTTKEIDIVFEPFAKFFAERGIETHFPSVEEIMIQSLTKQK